MGAAAEASGVAFGAVEKALGFATFDDFCNTPGITAFGASCFATETASGNAPRFDCGTASATCIAFAKTVLRFQPASRSTEYATRAKITAAILPKKIITG